MMCRVSISLSLVILAGTAAAQRPDSGGPATFERPGYEGPLPVLADVGTYQFGATNGYGYWRGYDAYVWIRKSPRFMPVFIFDSQTRPDGTQQNYAFFSYANWSKSFYTTQGFSFAPHRDGKAVYWPGERYDFKAFYKLPASRRVVLNSGFTYFDYPGPVHGEIYNAGFLYYPRKMVVEGNLYLNHNSPGNLWSGAGSLAVQYGQEGKYWLGAVAGGGKEVYRFFNNTALEVNLGSYSFQVFYRKWISRHTGFVLAFDNQHKFNAYTRFGAFGRMFFEF